MHLPNTERRVPEHTAPSVNMQIEEETAARLRHIRGRADVRRRLEELDEEWDVERVLEANAATIALIGVTLAATVDRRWLLLPGAVAAFLLQHALQGWCPPLPLIRRLGVRTTSEIQRERQALLARLS